MKKTLLTLFTACIALAVLGQGTTQQLVIKGSIVDSVTSKPIGYVTVTLEDFKTKRNITSTVTKEDGGFEIKTEKQGSYELLMVFVGYKNKSIRLDSADTLSDLGKVPLSPESRRLKEVAITAIKPLVTQEIDRIAYDVQADPESKTENVLDLLRKVPLISIDASDNIQLKGSGNYKILINGRASSLVAHNPSDVFRAMPAANIQKIEVITIPPAKYDAEGLAGIINIITVKKIDQGYNGSISASENNLYGDGASFSFTAKEGKFGLSTFTGFNNQIPQNANSTTDLETFGSTGTTVNQTGLNTNSGKLLWNSEELSYDIDSLNLITGSFAYNDYKFVSNNNIFSQTFDQENNLTESYRQVNNNISKSTAIDLDMNYQLGFRHNKDQFLTLSYKYTSSPYLTENSTDIPDRFNYSVPALNQRDNTGTSENTFQLDYLQPFKKLNIEGGLKAILRKSFSDFETDDLDTLTNTYTDNPKNANDFNYDQNIFSFYNTYHYSFDNWGFKMGARVENTRESADFTSVVIPVIQNYTNIIPSLSVQRKFKNNISVTLGFTNRIQRPSITQLNPFVDSLNSKFISTGNPGLKPVLNHLFDLNYSEFSNGAVNAGLAYSFASNTIQNVTKLLDSATYTTYQNLGSDRILGAYASVNYPLTKKLRLNINGQLSRIWLKGYIDGQLYTNSGIQGNGFIYLSYRIISSWRAALSGGLYSANVLLQGKSSAYDYNTVSSSKDLFNKKATVTFYISNPFSRYISSSSYTRDMSFYQDNMQRSAHRSVAVNFSYRFGKLKDDIKKSKHGIENDDLKNTNKSGTGNQ